MSKTRRRTAPYIDQVLRQRRQGGWSARLRAALSLLLSAALTVQPVLAQSVPIVATPGGGTSVGVADNGVPIIDIARPNGAGLSQNRYDRFGVGAEGAILNNATDELSLSQLGGLVQGNPNLLGTSGARVILNEVTGTSRSTLEGALEVHGRGADVIVANPNGITCNGCGFINTPRVTLSTGVPEISADGRVERLRVTGGDILIGSRGADLRSSDVFDLVARQIRLEGPVAAGEKLGLTAGRVVFDYTSREASSLPGDASDAPEVAIDSTLLGGMQAGQIQILATEAGAGVRMRGDMAAHTGQMTLTADGKLVLRRAEAKGSVTLRSVSDGVRVETSLFSEAAIELRALTAVELAAGATVTSASDVALAATDIGLEAEALAGAGVGRDGTLGTTGRLAVSADKLVAKADARLLAGSALDISADRIALAGAADPGTSAATLVVRDRLTVHAWEIEAGAARVRAGGAFTLGSDQTLILTGGDYAAGGPLLVEAAGLLSSADFASDKAITCLLYTSDAADE